MLKPVPCQHIADFYQRQWEAHKCIGWNLLRRGYAAWASGTVTLKDATENNLFRGILSLK